MQGVRNSVFSRSPHEPVPVLVTPHGLYLILYVLEHLLRAVIQKYERNGYQVPLLVERYFESCPLHFEVLDIMSSVITEIRAVRFQGVVAFLREVNGYRGIICVPLLPVPVKGVSPYNLRSLLTAQRYGRCHAYLEIAPLAFITFNFRVSHHFNRS